MHDEYDPLSVLQQISDVLPGSPEWNRLFPILIDSLAKNYHVQGGAVYLEDQTEGELHLLTHWRISERLLEQLDRFSRHSYYRWQVEQETGQYPVSDFIDASAFLTAGLEFVLAEWSSYLAIPLYSEDQTAGIAYLFSQQLDTFRPPYLPFYETLGKTLCAGGRNHRG